MAEFKRDSEIIYRCPMCLQTLNDVTIDKDEDGVFHCMKCSFTGTHSELIKKYAEFRSKYKLLSKRITLEEQLKM